MNIIAMPVGIYAANCYLVIDNTTKESFILDPGGDSDYIINTVTKHNAKINYILLTHGHFDHTGAAVALSEKYKVPIYISKKDDELVVRNEHMFEMQNFSGKPNMHITEKMTLSLGKATVRCIETPGHTPGGVCYLVEGNLFTGDTLFAGSIGRTDFYGGDLNTLISNVKNKLFVLEEFIKVFPGHGPESTIGREKKTNPFF